MALDLNARLGNVIARLKGSATLRGISVLASGTIAAQLIIVLASPLITRLYTPEQFGFLAIFSALLNTLLVVSALRYQVAVPIAKERRDAAAIVVLSLVVVACFSLGLLLLVVFGGSAFASLVNASDDAAWLYLLPFAILLAGAFEVLRRWCVRTRTFKLMAMARLKQSIVMTAVQVAGFRLGVGALLIGQVAGRAAGVLQLARPFIEDTRQERATLSVADLRHQAYAFRRFPIHSTWGTLLNVSGRQFPAIFFAALADPAIAGFYALAQRILATPLSFVSDAISSVFASIASSATDHEALRKVVHSFHLSLSLLAAVPIVALMVYGPDAFDVIFGERWRQAGVFSAIMAPWIYLVFVSTPLMFVFSIRERDAELSFFQLALAVARVAALFGGWALGDAVTAIALFSGVSSIAYVILIMRIYVLSRCPAWQSISALGISLGAGLLIFLPVIVQRWTGAGGVTALLLSLMLSLCGSVLFGYFVAKRLLSMTRPLAGQARHR